MNEHEFYTELLTVLRERNHLVKEQNDIMATLDADVQAATTVINALVAALAGQTGSGVSAVDQSDLETAIAAGQAALGGSTPPPADTVTVVNPGAQAAVVGAPFTLSLSASGGTAPYSFATSGLPNGLSVSGSSVTGTPTGPDIDATVGIVATDSSVPPVQSSPISVQFNVTG